MPLYEYDCAGCGKTLEIIQKFSDPVLTECPECKGTITKKMSRTSFQLKGSGWYASDYKKSSAPPAPASEGAKETSSPKESGGHKHGGGCASGACGSGSKGD